MIIKYILHIVILIMVFSGCDDDYIGPGQTHNFIKYYGGAFENTGMEIIEISTGGYAVTGTIVTETRGSEAGLILTDIYGNSKTDIKLFGGNFNDKGYSIKEMPDGGFVILGSYQNTRQGDMDMYLIRTNAGGDSLWTARYGGAQNDEGFNLQITQDNNLIMVGYTESYGNGQKDIWLVKTDFEGKLKWTGKKTAGFSGSDEVGRYVAESIDGNGFVVAGYRSTTDANAQNSAIFIAQANHAGSFYKYSSIGETNENRAKNIIPLPGNNFIIAGTAYNPDNKSSDIYLARLDEFFNPVWEKYYGSSFADAGNAMITDGSHVHIFGTLGQAGNTSRMALISTTVDGGLIEINEYGESIQAKGNAVDITSDGGFVFTGSSRTDDYSHIPIIKIEGTSLY